MNKEQKTTFYIFVLAVALIVWKIWVLYSGARIYGYIVPPGQDPINHLTIIQGIMSGHWNATYPPLFHASVVFISRLFSIDPLTILKNLSPLLVLLPPIAIYIFLSKNFSRLAGIIGFTVTILSSNYGLVAYGDGNYPNILSAGFFMPIALAYIVKAFKEKPRKNVSLALIFILLMILTHHLTTALFLGVFIPYLIILTIWNKYDQIVPRLNKVVIALLACLAIGAVVIFSTSLKDIFLQALESLRANGSVLQNTTFLKIPTLSECSQMMGEFPFYLGLGAMIYLAVMLSRSKSEANKPGIILILIWFFVIFLLSRSSFVSLPSRIAREMGVPILLAIGVFMADILGPLKYKSSKIIVVGVLAIFIACSVVQVNAGAYQAPDFFSKMILFWPADKEKINFVNDFIGSNEKVLANPSSPYLEYFGGGKIVIDDSPYGQNEVILDKISKTGASYLMIINSFKPNPFEANIAADNATKERLKAFATDYSLETFTTFPDGSIIYKLGPALTLSD